MRFHEIVRWQRHILVYKQWQYYLQTTLSHRIQKFSPLQRRMILRENIQYQKRAFLKECFQQQKAYLVINALYRQHQTSRHIGQLELDLSQEKKRLQQDIDVLEKQLLSGLNLFQSLLSDCVLAVTNQPAFQYGQLAARAALSELDRHPNWPYLGAKLLPFQTRRIEQVNGLIFLSLSIGCTSWLSSSYELIS
ncbi:MAG: hypothetical protein JSR33_04675, partial [Proteobacteria bacterium]|nr:hypothetical protein [Pseudomonadota bacterium]